MRNGKHQFISAFVLVLGLMLLAVYAAGIVQPSARDIAEMNLLSEDPYELTIHFDLIDDDFVMYYDSTVLAQGSDASWDGKATVYYMNAFFYQDCVTLLDEALCCKEWRGSWASADFHSPLSMLAQLQEKAVAEDGTYYEIPVLPSDYSERLGEHYPGECYRLELRDVALDWQAMCDVNLDLSFGGQGQLQNIPKADITLFYGTEDLVLKGVVISYEDEQSWLSGTILVSPAPDPVEIDLSDYEIREDGLLREEWDIAIVNKEE